MATHPTFTTKRSKDSAKPSSVQAVAAPPTRQAQAADMARLQQAIADPGAASPSDSLGLQSALGNRRVNRLLADRAVQAKLIVGPAHDQYEEEANRAAMEVTRTTGPTPPPVQRESSPEEEEKAIQAKPATPGGGFEIDGPVESRMRATRGGDEFNLERGNDPNNHSNLAPEDKPLIQVLEVDYIRYVPFNASAQP